jgi:hypothetical protein
MNRSGGDQEFVPYQAYLIRLWPTRREGVAGCCVSLERVGSGQRFNFPDLESLFIFLQTEVEEWGPPRPTSNNPEEPDEAQRGGSNKWHNNTYESANWDTGETRRSDNE